MSAPDVLVVGAGITGAVAALSLAEAGASVEVLDAYGPASMASGWTLAGVRQSGRDPAELPLALEAVREWPRLEERLGAPTHYRQDGNLRLARTPDEVGTIRELVESQRAAGLDLEFLPDHRAVSEFAPVSECVLAASFCPTDGHADPVATVGAFVSAARRRGARFSSGERVVRLDRSGTRVEAVVTARRRVAAGMVLLATGTGTNALLEPVGVRLPLRVPMVTVVRTLAMPPLIRPVLGVANADLALRQEVSGALRFTSGAVPHEGMPQEEDGRPIVRPSALSLARTIDNVVRVLPAVSASKVEAFWGGLLDLTPDALPVIDRVPQTENLVCAAGFSGHGFGIGPVTGTLAADLCLERKPRLPLDAFRFARFETKKGSRDAVLSLHG